MWTWKWPFRKRYDIYTDGSYKHGRGAWAYVITRNGKALKEKSGRARKTTSNHMEITAAIEALKSLAPQSRAHIHTDSRILIATATELIPNWKSQNWKKKNGNPVPHAKLAQELERLLGQHTVTFQWVKAHTGVEFNERCDWHCVQERLGPQNRP